jgi:ATP-binding cassette subfamily F protein 3
MEGASAGYGEKPVLSKLDLVIADDDRIGLLGSNGNGKSTFAKLVAGKLTAMDGMVRRSSKLKVGYFAQHQLDELNPQATPVAHVRELLPDATEAQVRSRAAQMGFPANKADTPVANLSGGEKARLMMGLAAFDAPHLLILDEPTNHLDIDSRTALMEAINDYEGAVILISHDRFLLEACADRLWFVGGGRVKPFDGDLDAYRSLVLEGESSQGVASKSSKNESATSQADSRRAAVEKRQALAPLKKKIEAAEQKMAKLTELLARVDEALQAPDAFIKDPAKAAQLSGQRAELEKTLMSVEEEWLTLSADYESAV